MNTLCIKINNELHLIVLLKFLFIYIKRYNNVNISNKEKKYKIFSMCHEYVEKKNNNNKKEDIYLLISDLITIKHKNEFDKYKYKEIIIDLQMLSKEPKTVIGYLKLINF